MGCNQETPQTKKQIKTKIIGKEQWDTLKETLDQKRSIEEIGLVINIKIQKPIMKKKFLMHKSPVTLTVNKISRNKVDRMEIQSCEIKLRSK